ncbi:MAG: methyltransferase domain-containing protein [Thermoanaerobaculia bacterium]
MSEPKSRRPKGTPDREDKEATAHFYREWLRKPMSVAALSPSGKRLAEAVAAAVGSARAVVELGGGTGALTDALVARGIPDLVVVESVPAFCDLLRRRFPGVQVIEGDAAHAAKLLLGTRVPPGTADVVVSGLGMLTRPREEQQRLLEAMLSLLGPNGYIVQFTYSLFFPAARGLLAELGLEAHREGMTWINLPPASVFVVRRAAGEAVA